MTFTVFCSCRDKNPDTGFADASAVPIPVPSDSAVQTSVPTGNATAEPTQKTEYVSETHAAEEETVIPVTAAPDFTDAPSPTPFFTPAPPPPVPYYFNDYPVNGSEIAYAEAGKAFMNKLLSDPDYAELDLDSKKGYPYLICINCAMSCVTVFCADENGQYTRPYLSMVCSAHRYTITGIFKTKEKYSWHTLVGPSYGQYCTRIFKGILFHSVPYNTKHKYDLMYDEYNKLGTCASHGCIRLAVNDAKWIFDNCRSGTITVIYNDIASPGPMGRPQPIRIDAGNPVLHGWDPTDPDKYNPWGDSHKAGTTIRSELAQADYDYAMAHGLWDGSINKPEKPTPVPSYTPEPVPEETPAPVPDETPEPSPEITPEPSGNPTEIPTEIPSQPADTPQPGPTSAPDSGKTAETPYYARKKVCIFCCYR